MLNRSTLMNLCSAAVLVLGLAAPSAHAQTTTHASSRYSGTFSTSHIDSNGDGIVASLQDLRLTRGPFGPSLLQGLDEFVIVGPGTCANGNPGLLFTQLTGPQTPAALVQRFERSGDLLYLVETSSAGCADNVTGEVQVQSSGQITGGTGAFAGATGSWTQTSSSTALFVDARDSFGGESGTFNETIVQP